MEPIRVAIVNDYEIVVAGVAAVLAPFADRVTVVELDSGLPTVSEVDLVLYDTFGQKQGDHIDPSELVRDSSARVVVFSWNTQADLVERAVARGAAGYLSKSMTAAQLVASLEQVAAGEVVLPSADAQDRDDPDGPSEPRPETQGAWPGAEHGLTAREAEVVALITQGFSNQEIASQCYLSINSVKTYIRTAYRKMGVGRRAQAVLWGIEHGFTPDHVRVVADDERRPPG